MREAERIQPPWARALPLIALAFLGCNPGRSERRGRSTEDGTIPARAGDTRRPQDAVPAAQSEGGGAEGDVSAPPVDPRLLLSAKAFESVHLDDPDLKLEEGAVAALRAIAAAQAVFRRAERYPGKGLVYANRRDGRGFPDLYRVGGPAAAGPALELIDKDLAAATSPDHAKSGYYFVDITADAKTGAYDYSKEFGICAVPVRYNPGRGPPKPATIVIDATGRILKAATAGQAVTVFPDAEDGRWIPP